jgi:tRNA nucleotidyltransferase (CCA-adding enzyme)
MDVPAQPGELPGSGRLLARLGALPGGERLLAVATPATYLVGGAVRDLLLGRAPRELDVVVEGDAAALAAALGATPVEHRRFGTALVELPGGARVDVAGARRERYATPGALPDVEPAPLPEDLLRRDFTVNAIAVALAGEDRGELRAAPDALEDLRAGRLRVLHEDSFRDDPTRLLRLARYRARLGFDVEPGTAGLAAAAIAGEALATVSGARLGAELRLTLAEPDAVAALAELDRLGVLRALHPRLRCESAVLHRALSPLAADAEHRDRPDLLLLAGIALPLVLRAGDDPGAEIAALLDRLEFPAGDRDRAVAAAVAVPALVDALPATTSPSGLRELLRTVPPEGVALAGALDEAAARAARRWLGELRDVRLRIGGEDLLAAGVPQGPDIGRRLEQTLRRRLDGELPDERDPQLRAALQPRL